MRSYIMTNFGKIKMCVYMCMTFPGSSAGKESVCNAGSPGLIPGSRRSPGGDRLPTPVFLGFPGGSETTCNSGDLGLIPGLERSP